MPTHEIVLKGGRLDGSVRFVVDDVTEITCPDSESLYMVTQPDGTKRKILGTLNYRATHETDNEGRIIFRNFPVAPPKNGVLLSDRPPTIAAPPPLPGMVPASSDAKP